MKILVVYTSFPEADTGAGAARLLDILRILCRHGYEITFLAQVPGETRYLQELEKMGIECICDQTAGLSASPSEFDLFLKSRDFKAALLVQYNIYVNYAPRIRASLPHCPLILDTVDLVFLREQRQAEWDSSLRTEEGRERLERERNIEHAAFRDAEAIWVVTDSERKIIEEINGDRQTPICVIPTTHTLIDNSPNYDERQGLVFLGGYRHAPNRDAVQFFMTEIYPLIQMTLPDVPVLIAGSHPSEDMRQWEARFPTVSVTGFIPDHRALLASSRIGLAPLRFGAGMKGKIGEYLACGLPCVSTSIGTEGMGLTPERDVLAADSPQEFAEAVLRLYRDRSLWNTLSDGGRRHISRSYTPDAITPALLSAFSSLPPARPQFPVGNTPNRLSKSSRAVQKWRSVARFAKTHGLRGLGLRVWQRLTKSSGRDR